MAKAITLEFHGEDVVRAVVLQSDSEVTTAYYVADIFEADEPNLNSLWALIDFHHPDLCNLYVPGGEIIPVDQLSVREAAECHFVREA